MEDFLAQIRAANSANLYYMALFCTLTLPDICGSLEAPNGQAKHPLYTQWFDKYVAPKYYGFLDGETCYRFRCSMLHQGTSRPHSQNGKYSRIIFLEPNSKGFVKHNNVMNEIG